MKDVEFMTARDKELTLKAWKTFVKHGFKFEHFTDRLYKHLILHCSFIAHFNRAGFYATYFRDPEATIKFLGQFDTDKGCRSIEYGDHYWIRSENYNDINMALVAALKPSLRGHYARLSNEAKSQDLSIAKALLAKHGLTASFV